MELQGKRALVTGASRGIGRVIALAFAAEGASLGLLARRGSDLSQVVAASRDLGVPVRVCQADLGEESQVRPVVSNLVSEWGGIDILVNNAGMQGPIGPLPDNDFGQWQRTLRVNLGGSALCTQLVLPAMLEQDAGKVIYLSGGGAVSPRPRLSAYAASKAGVVRLMECVSAEVVGTGIDVNAIAPGAVNTDMHRELLEAGDLAGSEERAAALDRRETGGQPPGKAAALAVYLASARSDGLSGKLISAVYDAWEDLDIGAAMASDIYTLRRIDR